MINGESCFFFLPIFFGLRLKGMNDEKNKDSLYLGAIL